MKYAVFMWGVRAGTIEFNDNASGRELEHVLKNEGFSIQPLTEPVKVSRSSGGGIGAALVRQMIESYEKEYKN